MSSMAATAHLSLILGCGYLGRRTAARWLSAGKRVAALTRGNAHELSKLGIDPIMGDVLDPNSLKSLPTAETVLYAVGWDRASGSSMREVYVSGLNHLLDTLPACSRFIHVSSTGVYGQTDGELVDESSATEPLEPSGQVVLEAERLLRSRRPDAIILRFAGMYGPDRLLRRQPLLAGEPLVGDAEKWLNLIHIDDGAEAVLAAEKNGKSGETYNIVDDEPVKRRAFYTLLADLLASPPARFEQQPEPGRPNRRVSNSKARRDLGWEPHYPSCRDGLPDAVARSLPPH
jgi:nucleoside-diphosphate-sugar epimerase